MMALNLFVFWQILLMVIPHYCLDQASFYGSSFISMPLKEAKGYTNISFKFRTYLPDALILLVAGTTDYCILRLDDGRLKLNINLGAGEFEISSPQGIKLNDFKWHQVLVTRKEANLSLNIDSLHQTKKRLPGKFFELNVHYGLFVGGYGNFTDIFFGHQENFRGCLGELVYNGISVLEKSRRRQSETTIVHGVTWNCASEFNADLNQPISFVNDEAFLTLTVPNKIDSLTLSFEVKTLSEKNAIVLFNTGLPTKPDTFSLELSKGRLRLLIKSTDAKVDLTSDAFVADGHWHKVSIRIALTSVELNIDSSSKPLKVAKPIMHTWDATDLLYVGGVDSTKRSRIASKGFKIAEDSFKGCVRYLKIGERAFGLKDAHISEGLLNGCIWQFPCLNDNPCSSDRMCIQESLDSYRCMCESDSCTNSTYVNNNKVISRGNLATDMELLILEPLHVLEGYSALITVTNLHVVLDYPKYGISESGIIFHIIEPPQHGSIVIDVWIHEKDSFTLSDISSDKVYYVHDGSEYFEDRIVMEVEFSAAEAFILPIYLQGRFRLMLTANITPVNDPPILSIPSTVVLRLARGTKKTIGKEYLYAKDPDGEANQLVYSIVDPGAGHLEIVDKLGVAISSFTQEEVDNNKILYVHDFNASDDSYLSLRVSDGIETSKISKLRISAFAHYWRIRNNTGLTLMHQTFAVITSFNLSFISNVPDAVDEAQYYITQEPQFGVVEIERNNGVWKKSTKFTSEDLRRRLVRYRHTTAQPSYDEFQFYTNLNGSATYTFRITLKKCNFVRSSSQILELRDTQQVSITSKQIAYKTEPITASTMSVLYVLTHVPTYGYLLLSNSKYRLTIGDAFTQEDVSAKNINYHLFHKTYSHIYDSFKYTVTSPGCKNVTGNVTIEYYPSHSSLSKVNLVLKPLDVEEGAQTIIDKSHLNIITVLATEIQFNITKGPSHGFLEIQDESPNNRSNFFTLKDIYSNRVFYIHDDSESRNDSFQFVALSKFDYEDFQYAQVFKINVKLKNDNRPVRLINKVFNVVVNSERLLTGNNLKYIDVDLDTPSSDIIYNCHEITNGELFKNYTNKVTEFSQKDLDDSSLLFKHHGSKRGKISMWITDGHFYVDGILEIQASAPFIRVYNSKKLITQQGKWSYISNQQLVVDTNIFATENDIIFEIVTKPVYGKIVLAKTLQEVDSFTKAQVNKEQILYVHEDISSLVTVDQVYLRVRCKDAINVTQIDIWILPSSYWDPLVVKNLRELIVEESTSALIDNKILEISQPDGIPAATIIYSVVEYPQNGYLSVAPISEINTNESLIVSSFSQALINENKLVYVQSKANKTSDRIIFNVTNSMVSLSDIFLEIKIIPEHLYLGSDVLSVKEGGTVTLTESQIYVKTVYYKSQVNEYVIVQQPIYGWLERHGKSVKLNSFTHEELIYGKLQYTHDNSENLYDEIVIVAVTNTKRSTPIIIPIHILPVNDHKPELVNNTGLKMWEGGVSIITNQMLAAVDFDQPPETIRYQLLGCWWGNISLLTEPTNSLRFFTQESIDKGVVVFRHQNGTDAKFSFNISDGLYSTEVYSFHIKTKPVTLELVKNSRLHVFPLQKKQLTTKNLLASISDPERMVYFKINKPPTLGHVLLRSNMKDDTFQVITIFSQLDVNEGRVYYEHTHRFEDLYVEDSFTFNVESHLATPLTEQKFKIDTSVSSGGLDAYIKIPKIRVDEGGMTNIKLNLSGVIAFLENHAGLKSPIIHATIITPSNHGQVFVQKSSNVTTVTQQQLENGQLHYQHDHSDSLQDRLYLTLYLIPGYIFLCNVTVPIEVNPINDQAFRLVTRAPHFLVVQGENHTISADELCTEDVDTIAADIHYDVVTGPEEGKLLLLPGVISISHFSQDDINNGKLIYIHTGSSLIDAFNLRVWDGHFKHEYTVLNIQVIPVSVNVSAGFPLYLQQGSNVVLFSHKQFVIETNADLSKIQYAVKENPKHGLLYVKDSPATIFGQGNLDNDEVMYMQTDMTTANDSAKIFVTIPVGNISSVGEEVEIFIKVQPLMQIRNFTAVSGIKNRLSLGILDATPLAKLTNSNPRYTITNFPKFGEIRKIIRRSGENKNVLNIFVNSFTHEEIQSGLIYLVTKNIEIGYDDLQDELQFILAATIFQPAVGKLKIIIKSHLHNDIFSTLASPSNPAGREGGMHMASPNMTRDYFLIVSMVVGVIILGVTVIVIIKCRTIDSDLSKEEQSLQPIPLPRPPDTLMPTPSPIKQHVHDGFTSPIPSRLPQCKVTPLNDKYTGYPYGIEDHLDDWSSCDASDPSCPAKNNIMLRRNQYWV